MYPEPYIQFLVHFHGDRDYFECHEILEEYWKELANEGKTSIWVGLILVAVSNYHYRRNNLNGAFKTLAKAISIFQDNKHCSVELGIDMVQMLSFLSNRLLEIQSDVPYSSFNLPIVDKSLLKQCQDISTEKGFMWGKSSDFAKRELLHRHTLRDRTEVFQEREKAILNRNKKEGRNLV
ncbi:DUF309 domain-containing protein [Bacillus sp. T3]|uniref:DUF309 domain-containing protein n=1 Tax=Bacillus sp. T3 TaxID=467262 RepID=UPI002980F379|nr:DUF309 domain-containing protein [Bacillus sp. T3]